MSYNGSGTFLINTAGQPVVSGTVISSTAFNALTADLATGLSTAITKDGQTTVTANIPMGTYKFTGLGAGTAATDSANLSQVQSTVTKLLASVSGADTITAVGSPTLGAYAAGQMFYFVAASANTGAVTINIDSLGAKSITRDGTTALAAGDIQSGEVCVIVYDGTQFQLVNGASQSASIVTENLTVNKATVLNESGGDNDTRIEGDTDANLVFVDASTDRVGFGTSSPGAKTEVYVNRTSSTNAVSLILNDNVTGVQTNGVYKAIRSVSNGGGAVSEIRFMETDGTNNNTSISFATQSTANALTERLRIDQNGNLGLGVTPAAWYTADNFTRAVQISTTGALVANDSAMRVAQNLYFNSAGAATYLTTGAISQYLQNAGQHVWANAPSGTANTAATLTTRMTLDASGNLLTGAATASGSGLLSIAVGNATGGAVAAVDTDGARIEMQAAGALTYLLATTNHPIVLGTNNTERARIHSDGAATFGNGSSNNYGTFAVRSISTTGGHQAFTVRANNASELLVLFQNGSLYCQGVYDNSVGGTNRDVYVGNDGIIGYLASVRASKTNITPVLDANWLLQLNPVTFSFRKKDADGNYTDETDGEIQHGLIAEEVEAVKPELCFYDEVDGKQELRGVSYSKLVTPMLKLIQQQQAAIAALEAKVAALEAK